MAVLKQERHVELVPGANELFVITNEMFSAVIPDQLPHLNVFVIAVADEEDAKQDTLARVANIADLTLIPIGRDAGIAAPGPNGIEFLSQACTVSYTTLETANDAATAFVDRVNALIEGWITFRTEFNAPDPTPASYTLPHVDPSQKEALIAAYTAAKQAGYTQLQVKNEADAALTRANADYAYKQSLLPGVATILTGATKVQGELAAVITQFGTFVAANPGGTGVTAATAQLAATPGYNVDANTLVADVTAYQTARQNDVTASATALATAQADQITQSQALTAANALTATALAAVLAVCPDFDPTSIPYVPG
jgi:hypothetical protein